MSTTVPTIVHLFSGDLWAGAERMIYTLLTALNKSSRYRVMAVSMNVGTLSKLLAQAGVETHVMHESSHSFPALVARTHALLRTSRVSLVHAHRYKENLLGAAVAKLLGVRAMVSTVHGATERTADSDRGPSAWIEAMNYYALRNWYTCVVAVSEDLKRRILARLDERRTVVIHNGISVPHCDPVAIAERDVLRVGTAGRLVAVKDLELFLRVAAEVCRHKAEVKFHVLGDGPMKEALLRRRRELGLEQVVVFEGHREDTGDFYASLDVYLNTSVHEGLPLSLLEAMAMGKPVVAPRVGGIPEIIKHGVEGFLVEGRVASEFAGYCLTLLQDSELRRAMGARASNAVHERFSEQGMLMAYQDLYEQVLRGSFANQRG